MATMAKAIEAAAVRGGGGGGAGVVEVDDVVHFVTQYKTEVNLYCEEEREHQRRALRARQMKEFLQQQARQIVQAFNDPQRFAAVQRQRFYDLALRDTCPQMGDLVKSGASDSQILTRLMELAEAKLKGKSGMLRLVESIPTEDEKDQRLRQRLAFFLPDDDERHPTLICNDVVIQAVRRVFGIPTQRPAAPAPVKTAKTFKPPTKPVAKPQAKRSHRKAQTSTPPTLPPPAPSKAVKKVEPRSCLKWEAGESEFEWVADNTAGMLNDENQPMQFVVLNERGKFTLVMSADPLMPIKFPDSFPTLDAARSYCEARDRELSRKAREQMPEAFEKPAADIVTPKMLNLTLEELRWAVSIGQLQEELCKRVIAFSGTLWGVYDWNRAEEPGETFTLMRMVPIGLAEVHESHPQPETFNQRRTRLRKVDKTNPGGLIVAGPDGERYVIDETVRMIVSADGEKAGATD